MIVSRYLIKQPQFTSPLCYTFSKLQTYMVSKEQAVIDMSKIIYTPQKKIKFYNDPKNGKRAPLYIWKPRIFAYQRKYAKYTAAFIAILQLMRNNPFYHVFPASLPIMFCIETLIVCRFMQLAKQFRYVVKEIWLHYGGETLEIVFAKQIARKLMDQPTKELLFTPNISTPPQTEDVKPMIGHLFPIEIGQEDNTITDPFPNLRWAWHKYYYNTDNFIILPKNADYINMEILTACFRGQIIQNTKEYVDIVDEDPVSQLIQEYKQK